MNIIETVCYSKGDHDKLLEQTISDLLKDYRFEIIPLFWKKLELQKSNLAIIIEEGYSALEISDFLRKHRFAYLLLIVKDKFKAFKDYSNIFANVRFIELSELENRITIKRFFEEILLNELNKLQKNMALMKHVTDSIVLFDKNLNVKFMNDPFMNTFDITTGKTINLETLFTQNSANPAIVKMLKDFAINKRESLFEPLLEVNSGKERIKFKINLIDYSLNSPISDLHALILIPIMSLNTGNRLLVEKFRETSFLNSLSESFERPQITVSAMFEELIGIIPDFFETEFKIIADIEYSGKKYNRFISLPFSVKKFYPIIVFGQLKGQLILGIFDSEFSDKFHKVISQYNDLFDKVLSKLSRTIEHKILQNNLVKTLGFQKTLYEISYNLSTTSKPEDEISNFLPQFSHLLGTKFIIVSFWDETDNRIRNSHFQGDEKFKSVHNFIKENDQAVYSLKNVLMEEGYVHFSTKEKNNLITDSSLLQTFKSSKVSYDIYALISGTNFLGFVCFAGLEQSLSWSSNFAPNLRIFLTIFSDALEREKNNIQIAEQYLFLKNLLNTVPVPVIYTNKDEEIIGTNSSAQFFFNRGTDHLLGKTIMAFKKSLAPDNFSEVDDIFQKGEYSLIINNDRKEVIVSKSDYYDSANIRLGTVYSFLDISDLKNAQQEVLLSHIENEKLLNSISSYLISVDENFNIIYSNKSARKFLETSKTIKGQNVFGNFRNLNLNKTIIDNIIRCLNEKQEIYLPSVEIETSNKVLYFDVIITFYRAYHYEKNAVLLSMTDISERIELERKLMQSQKLESIGQLAAGIAHEINTPSQYVTDNLNFLKDSFVDIKGIIDFCERTITEHTNINEETKLGFSELKNEIDLEFLMEEIPEAIRQSIEGSGRITTIVRAMKDFSHPGVEDRSMINLNNAVQSTITICRNEWKYHAEMITDFADELPHVNCNVGEINQVVLNMIVNATHSIIDANKKFNREKGLLEIKTFAKDDYAIITVKDNGLEIPEKNRNKIFDPFFTTKEIGKGTGQGLSIAYSVIVDKHKGRLHFDTKIDEGTTFFIELPFNQEE
ncbi:MAG: ATP-binding protein [Candidatus Cloacimonetes bacterium]|nr:ATP-binding protein [Candidatus Cloacimonadota bacterium]